MRTIWKVAMLGGCMALGCKQAVQPKTDIEKVQEATITIEGSPLNVMSAVNTTAGASGSVQWASFAPPGYPNNTSGVLALIKTIDRSRVPREITLCFLLNRNTGYVVLEYASDNGRRVPVGFTKTAFFDNGLL